MEESQNSRIGVFVGQCQFEKNLFVHRPTVSVELVDSRTGVRLCASSACIQSSAVTHGSNVPIWNETVIIDYPYEAVRNATNTHCLLLFEITDDVLESRPFYKSKRSDSIKTRLAWAFLKPVAANQELNLEKDVRLQLFKISKKKCSTPHPTCPIFHLYAEHKRKKLAGSLYVRIAQSVREEQITSATADDVVEDSIQVSSPRAPSALPQIAIAEWSRLPTQLCKLPNAKLSDFNVTRRGCSSIAFSPCGKFIACGSFSKIVVGSVLEKPEMTRLSGHTGLIYELSWSANGELLLSVSADCSAIIWTMKPANKNPSYVLPHPSFVYCGKWMASSKRLLTGGKGKKIRYWGETESGFELLEEFGDHDGFVSAIEVVGEDVAISGDSKGAVAMWRLREGQWALTGQFTLRETVGCAIDAIQMHPGLQRLAVTARTKGSLMLDIGTGAVLRVFSADTNNARNVPSLSPCGSLLFTFAAQNTINVWEFETGRLRASLMNVFLDGEKGALSGVIQYHPWDHIVAFGVLGDNHPVVLLKFDRNKDESTKLGLIYHEDAESDPDFLQENGHQKSKPEMRAPLQKEGSMEDKLAAIVRNIDRVLAAKREMTARVSSSYTRNANKVVNGSGELKKQ